MDKLIPEVAFSNYLDNLADPINIIVGNSWNDNLDIDKKIRSKKSNSRTQQEPEIYISYR